MYISLALGLIIYASTKPRQRLVEYIGFNIINVFVVTCTFLLCWA